MATKRIRSNTVYGYPNPQTSLPQPPIIQFRSPTTADSADIGTMWINSAINSYWVLTNIVNGINIWTATSGGSETLTNLVVDPGNITITAGDLFLNAGDINVLLGDINLPVTTDINHGTITVAGNSFIHSYGAPCNTFVGQNAGNFTLTGSRLTGIGCSTLHAVTSGSYDTALGSQAHELLTTGSYNVAIGSNAQGVLTTGTHNTSVGSLSLSAAATNSARNTTVGFSSLTNATNPSDNIVLGYLAGSAYITNENNNILIGNSGVVADGGVIRIGTNAVHTACYITGIDATDLNTAKIMTEKNNQLGAATLTAGSGISITPGAGIITITATGAGTPVQTITGNSGGALTPTAGNINIVTANSTIKFVGSGSTETLDFAAPVNFALGNTLSSITSGSSNLCIGGSSGSKITSGHYNICIGLSSAGGNITEGQFNICIGGGTGNQLTIGSGNVIIGGSAGVSLTGDSNVFVGYSSGILVTSGVSNTFLGNKTSRITTGSNNILLGDNCGFSYTSSESSNIVLGNTGVSAESHVIRVGTSGSGDGQQNKCYIAGIDGVNVGSVAKVVTEASDQLGTATITAGTGITVTPGANTITIASTVSAGIQTLTGNTGGAISPSGGNINIVTANSTPIFAGSGSTQTLDFNLTNNLVLGNRTASLSTGAYNVGLGGTTFNAITTGNDNASLGYGSLNAITTGSDCVSLGYRAGITITTGSNDILIGSGAGSAYTSSESSNICISNTGVLGESNVIRIGTTGSSTGQQNKCYIAGIDGVNVGSVAKVVTEASGQLGTATITAGTGISVTPGANTITIAATTGGVTSITGNSGGALTGALSIVTANSTVKFIGSGSTETLDFAYTDNLILGAAPAGITIGAQNTALGAGGPLTSITSASGNVAIGFANLVGLVTGSYNVSIGFNAGSGLTIGNQNILIGNNAGSNYSSSESSNITIGHVGVITESNVVRIGTNGSSVGQQNACYIAGIDGVNVGSVAKVVTEASGQLGTATITAGTGISVTPGANTITIAATGGSGGFTVTTFNSSGTWTKGANTKWMQVVIYGGGGGGGSGRRGASTASGGGGGGSVNGTAVLSGIASYFPASANITIGAGGTGGSSQTSDNTNGIQGNIGGISTFGDSGDQLASFSGSGGTTTTATGGTGTTSQIFETIGLQQPIAGTGGTAGSNISPSSGGTPVCNVPPTGGGGGAGADSGTPRTGASSAYYKTYNPNGTPATIVNTGVGGVETGTIDGGNGSDQSTALNLGYFAGATGGGGGGGQSTGLVAGKGGNGGFPGGGGGGGGGSLNGTNSGAGGNGGNGQVIVIEFA